MGFSMQFHGIQWNSVDFSMEFHSMEFSMQFHEKFMVHGIPFNGIFHGILWKIP
jgi:hypothetical protein